MKGEKRFAVYMEDRKHDFAITAYDGDSRNPAFLALPQICLPFPPLLATGDIKISLEGPWSLVRNDPRCLFCLMLLQNIRTHWLFNTPRFPPMSNSRVDLDSGHRVGEGAGHFTCSVNNEITC